jgi:hypothetical protein
MQVSIDIYRRLHNRPPASASLNFADIQAGQPQCAGLGSKKGLPHRLHHHFPKTSRQKSVSVPGQGGYFVFYLAWWIDGRTQAHEAISPALRSPTRPETGERLDAG